MITTKLCTLLGIDFPIISAPMTGTATAELGTWAHQTLGVRNPYDAWSGGGCFRCIFCAWRTYPSMASPGYNHGDNVPYGLYNLKTI